LGVNKFSIVVCIFVQIFISELLIAQPANFNSFQLKEHSYSQNTLNLKLKNKAKDSFDNPFRFGLEFGRIISLDGNSNYNLNSLWGYIDINLYHKVTFLKFELGKFFDDPSSNSGFVSIGLNFKVFKSNQHNIFLQISGALAAGKGGAGFFGIFGPKYLFAINKFIGISTAIKYLFTGEHYLMFSAGIQIPTN